MKLKCKCGKLAVWCYMPTEHSLVCCEDCVPRGCSCNEYPIDGDIENLNPNNWKQEVDEQGRELPCIEWWYDEEGWGE
jgi:hypothetical protein